MEWNPNQQYQPGDTVKYQGRTYRAVLPHAARPDLIPSSCPALWAGQSQPSGVESAQPAQPQPTRTQPIPAPPAPSGGNNWQQPTGNNRGPPLDDRREGQPDDRRGGQYDDRRGGQYDDRRGPQYDDRRGPEYGDRRDGQYDDRRGAQWDDRRGGPEQRRQYGDDPRGGLQQYPESGRRPEWDDRGDDRGSERRDRDYGRGDRTYEGDRYGREPPQQYDGRSDASGANYKKPTHFKSAVEWEEDARRRARDFSLNGSREPVFWVYAEAGQVSSRAIQAGEDQDGGPIFIARYFHEGGLHIGWATSGRKAAISYGGTEIPLQTFEVLAGDSRAVRWISSKRREGTPIEGGYEASGQPLWITQVMIGGRILSGKTAGWDSGAHVANQGREELVPTYNILCHA